jgi:carbamate kinase
MRIVVALGGNALLKRGQPLTAQAQAVAVDKAARLLANVASAGHQLVITHGNGPQVGLLALQSAAGPAISALPLDVLGAESEGWIGYAIELALRNALPEGAAVVTVLTQTLVDPKDAAFAHPTKPIGPVYDEAVAKKLAETNNWSVAPDGAYWRRVVASPKPLGIVELSSIKRLMESGAIVICAGGGGIPVVKGADQKLAGIEAVIDKDASSGLLAAQIGADMFVMLTDVAGVCIDYGTKSVRVISDAGPKALADMSTSFGTGSMGPKVAAACRFVSATGYRAAIGALGDLNDIIAGTRGTIVSPEGGTVKFRDSE